MIVPESLWQAAPQSVRLAPGRVDVWRAELNADAAQLQRFADTLSIDERAKAERFLFLKDRNRYVLARGVLRSLLARYTGIAAGDFRFALNPHGKPSLASGNESRKLRFNVSHSHNLALFAFTSYSEVGVDVEHIRPSVDDKRLAERFFSPPEVAALRALPEGEQNEAFFRCWTRKEAYIKARGEGFRLSLASFAVSLGAGDSVNVPIAGITDPEASRWSFRGFDAGGGYAGAVVAEGTEWSVSQWQWT